MFCACLSFGSVAILGDGSALRAGRIFDTPSLKGYTFVNFRLRSSTPLISTTSVCVCIRRKHMGLPLMEER